MFVLELSFSKVSLNNEMTMKFADLEDDGDERRKGAKECKWRKEKQYLFLSLSY